MAVTITTYAGVDAANDGETHIVELTAGGGTTQAFDAIEFGQGNNVPSASDTRTAMTSKIANQFTKTNGYPILGDSDPRNDGRAVDRWTWLFVIPEGQQILASNWIVTNNPAATAEPILCHSNDVVAKRADQVAYIWLNVTTAGVGSAVVHVEEGEPVVEQLGSWRQESIAMSGAPGATAVSGGVVRSRLVEGEQVWTAAYLMNGEGGTLTRDDVQGVYLRVYRRRGERDWVLSDEEAVHPYVAIMPAPVRTDKRWKPTRGYVFAHTWKPSPGWGSRATRLEYRIRMTAGDNRTLVHEVEWVSTRSN